MKSARLSCSTFGDFHTWLYVSDWMLLKHKMTKSAPAVSNLWYCRLPLMCFSTTELTFGMLKKKQTVFFYVLQFTPNCHYFLKYFLSYIGFGGTHLLAAISDLCIDLYIITSPVHHHTVAHLPTKLAKCETCLHLVICSNEWKLLIDELERTKTSENANQYHREYL